MKFDVKYDECPASHRRFEYLIEAMCRSRCIFIFHHESEKGADNTDEFIDRAMEIACVKQPAKILQIRKQKVKQYVPGCKEIVLTCGQSDVENENSQNLLIATCFQTCLTNYQRCFF